MNKEVTVLAIEGEFLRGVRLGGDDGAWERTAEECWPLSVQADGAVEAAEGGEADAAAREETVAADRPLVRAFREAAERFGCREFVLSLPLSSLLVKPMRIPAEARDDVLGAASMALDSISPFPDEPLTPAAETMSETDSELTVIAAALPDAPAAEITEALDLAKVRVTRTDATALGWLRMLWPRLCEKDGPRRRIVLLDLGVGWELAVLDDGVASALRGIGSTVDPTVLVREITLSVLQVEGATPEGPVDVVVCSRESVGEELLRRLAVFGEVREVKVEDDFAGAEGVARRTVEEQQALDLTPEPWREDLIESRFRRRLTMWAAVAAAVWAVVMGVLFGVDAVYGFLADSRNDMRKERVHARAFKEVLALTNRVALIERYADHSHGALEVLKTVSDCLPDSEDMSFRTFRYVRGESVRVQGQAGEREDVRKLTENLEGAEYENEDEDAEPVKIFDKVQQSGGETQNKSGGVRFTLEAFFPKTDEEGSR